ncbi:flagellar basal body component [Pelomyxa schiedti]|nr:flagellar basal body component [Pelomyxa schiedti]
MKPARNKPVSATSSAGNTPLSSQRGPTSSATGRPHHQQQQRARKPTNQQQPGGGGTGTPHSVAQSTPSSHNSSRQNLLRHSQARTKPHEDDAVHAHGSSSYDGGGDDDDADAERAGRRSPSPSSSGGRRGAEADDRVRPMGASIRSKPRSRSPSPSDGDGDEDDDRRRDDGDSSGSPETLQVKPVSSSTRRPQARENSNANNTTNNNNNSNTTANMPEIRGSKVRLPPIRDKRGRPPPPSGNVAAATTATATTTTTTTTSSSANLGSSPLAQSASVSATTAATIENLRKTNVQSTTAQQMLSVPTGMQSGVNFQLMVTGQIESCQIAGSSSLLARYEFVHGNDWTIISGVEKGITQTSLQTSSDMEHTNGPVAVWNHPLEIAFSSNNPYGWPQLVVCVYGPDFLGREVIQGYGVMHLPISSGRFVKYMTLWTPLSPSSMEQMTTFFIGQRPEYINPIFISQGAGREVTKVRSYGKLKVSLDVITKGMTAMGYSKPSTNPSQLL